jgi:hypothetical protein
MRTNATPRPPAVHDWSWPLISSSDGTPPIIPNNTSRAITSVNLILSSNPPTRRSFTGRSPHLVLTSFLSNVYKFFLILSSSKLVSRVQRSTQAPLTILVTRLLEPPLQGFPCLASSEGGNRDKYPQSHHCRNRQLALEPSQAAASTSCPWQSNYIRTGLPSRSHPQA